MPCIPSARDITILYPVGAGTVVHLWLNMGPTYFNCLLIKLVFVVLQALASTKLNM